MTYNLPRCPYCQSLDISPGQKMWHCNHCQRDFELATFEMEPPKEQKKKPNKEIKP